MNGMQPSVCEHAFRGREAKTLKVGVSEARGTLLQFSANTPRCNRRSSKSGDGGYCPPRERHLKRSCRRKTSDGTQRGMLTDR